MRWPGMNPQQGTAGAVAVLMVGLIALLVYATGGTLSYPDDRYPWDHQKYIAMAQAPFSDETLVHVAPFSWRVLTPLLVYASPFNLVFSFFLVSMVGLTLVGYFTYLYLRALGFWHWPAITGLLLFALLPAAFRFNLWDHFLTDPLALATVVIGFYLMEKRRDRLLALVLLVGVVNKEVALFLAPVYSLFVIRNYGLSRASILKIILVIAPATLAFFALRISIPAYNEYDPLALAVIVIQRRYIDRGLEGIFRQIFAYTIGTWGVLFALCLVEFKAKARWLVQRKEWLVFLLLVYAQMLFTGNTERLLVYAFPVVIPLALQSLAFFASSLRHIHYAPVVGSLVALQVALVLQQDLGLEALIFGAIALSWPLLEALRFGISRANNPGVEECSR